MKAAAPILCRLCGEEAQPARGDHRSVMCQPCADNLDAQMSQPLQPIAGTPAGFRRNDARMP